MVGKLIKKSLSYRNSAYTSESAASQQHKTFRKLLKKACETEFGKKYFFDQILTARYPVGLFQNAVPVHTYERINEEWWSRMRNGESNVCWKGSIKNFALSSGTSDAASKFIPVSKHMIRSIKKASMRQIYAMANYNVSETAFEKQVLMIGGSTTLTEEGGIFYGDMSGISAKHAMPKWFASQYFKPGYEITSMPLWSDRINAIVENASEWDISIICGIPNWIQMLFEKIIARYKVKTIHDIWPNLEVYVHGGIFFEPYKQVFRSFLKRDIMYAETYMASEGYFGFTDHPQANGIKLLLNNGVFYEFIPFTDDNFDQDGNVRADVPVYTIENIEPGIDYAVLISNNSGAWRYLIGDVIQFTNKWDHEIKISGRTKHYLSLCGEHLSVDNMTKAIRQLAQGAGIPMSEFSVCAVQDGKYFKHKWFVGTGALTNTNKFAIQLDRRLMQLNDDYLTARKSVLQMPEVEFVPQSLFYDWMKSLGKEGDQYKIPRVLKGTSLQSFLNFAEQELVDVRK